MGAGLTVSEMMSSNPQVWESDKSRLRMVHIDEHRVFAPCKLLVARRRNPGRNGRCSA
ncbi:hypothetical protein ACLK1U_18410 [Escherichia coli]